MIVVALMVVFIVTVVMNPGVLHGCHRIVVMRLGGKMDGDEIEVKGKQQRCGQTAPPTRPGRRATWIKWAACNHSQLRQRMHPITAMSMAHLAEALS